MNVESWGYTLVAAVLGMTMVFVFLVLLSAMMLLMRRVLDRDAAPAGGSGEAAAADGGGAPGGQGQPSRHEPANELSGGVPRWVSAAVLAYLCEEEREYRPRSGGWAVRRDQ